MRLHQWTPLNGGRGILLALGLALTAGMVVLASSAGSTPIAAQTNAKLESSVFSYDGQDFVRTKTTLMTKEGKSAVNTKLDRESPAYKALAGKHSYSGEVTVFGRKYDGHYAPLLGEDGKVTGALFVGAAK